MSKHYVLVLAIFCACLSSRAQQPAIIPQPVSAHWQQGSFSLNANTVIITDTSDRKSVV